MRDDARLAALHGEGHIGARAVRVSLRTRSRQGSGILLRGVSAVVLVVNLFIRPGQEVAFRGFETEAARVMQRHGGRIDRVIRPSGPAGEDPLPHEIHIVSFPNLERFEAYREDQHLAKLASLRESAIARTEVTIGEEGDPYV